MRARGGKPHVPGLLQFLVLLLLRSRSRQRTPHSASPAPGAVTPSAMAGKGQLFFQVNRQKNGVTSEALQRGLASMQLQEFRCERTT